MLSLDESAPVVAKVIDLGLAHQLAPITTGGLQNFECMAPETIRTTHKSTYNEVHLIYVAVGE